MSTMLARLLPIVALAVATVVAKPVVIRDSPISLAVARRFNATAAPNILKADQARAKALKQQAQGKHTSLKAAQAALPVTNGAVTYTASVGVGEPATQCTSFVPYSMLSDGG